MLCGCLPGLGGRPEPRIAGAGVWGSSSGAQGANGHPVMRRIGGNLPQSRGCFPSEEPVGGRCGPVATLPPCPRPDASVPGSTTTRAPRGNGQSQNRHEGATPALVGRCRRCPARVGIQHKCAMLFGECPPLRRQQVKHLLCRVACLHPGHGDNDRAVDEDRLHHHCTKQPTIARRQGPETGFGAGCAFLVQRVAPDLCSGRRRSRACSAPGAAAAQRGPMRGCAARQGCIRRCPSLSSKRSRALPPSLTCSITFDPREPADGPMAAVAVHIPMLEEDPGRAFGRAELSCLGEVLARFSFLTLMAEHQRQCLPMPPASRQWRYLPGQRAEVMASRHLRGL